MGTNRASESKQSRSATRKPPANKPLSVSAKAENQSTDSLNLQRAIDAPASAPSATLLQLQQLAGNHAVQRLLKNKAIQAKLTVGPANDKYEQEADQVASQVMRAQNPESPKPKSQEDEEIRKKPDMSLVQRATPLEEDEEIQKKPDVQRAAEEGFEAGSAIESQLAANKGSGNPLPSNTRSFMESRFGADFSAVRVHTGAESVQLNRELSAQAFTHGSDIYFGAGKYNPGAEGGKQLLAHELTHVIQQNGAETTQPVRRRAVEVSAGAVQGGTTMQLARGKAGRFFGSIGGWLLSLLPTLGVSALYPGLGDLSARMTFGMKSGRQEAPTDSVADLNQPARNKPYTVGGIAITAQDIGLPNDNFVLRGRRYDPTAAFQNGPGQGKAVILLSGSGGPNENQLEPLAALYTRQGSTVFAVNYRGFGRSRDKNTGLSRLIHGKESSPYLTEQGLYDDAYKIYLYVSGQGFADNNIVIHGYSLGGAVAANLTKKLAKQGKQLGGLVLHSSIKTSYEAAKGMVGVPGYAQLAGLMTKMSAGSFDTPEALQEIAQHDPNLPIHVMSGSGANEHLAVSDTDLQNEATGAGFTNVSGREGQGGHLQTGQHLTPRQRDFLTTLVGRGRARNPGNLEEVQAV